MKVIVDGEAKGWTFDSGKSLEEAVRESNQRLLAEEGRIVVNIKLDDFDEGLDTELTWDKVPVSRIKQISLETEVLRETVYSHLAAGQRYLEESRVSISAIVGDMLSGDVASAMEAMKDSIEKLIWFFNLLTQIGDLGGVDMEGLKVKNESFRDFVVRFNTTLNEIADSMASQDTTLINDFLEYELEPAIGDLIELIPAIRDRVDEKFGKAEEQA